MKVLTIAIPCYNSESYMKKAVESLLIGSSDLEILIIDDGSCDSTSTIADNYERKYPNLIRAIHKKNGGHGDAVNTGLKNSTGVYFKVLDSDDWLDKNSLKEVLSILTEMIENKKYVDMFITNYVYENVTMHKSKSINYKGAMPENKIFTWDNLGHFKNSQNILMHSVIYRSNLLRECKLELPKHTFYVDNIFVYKPLPYVKTMYYADLDLYRYFIGRDDQSVNEKIMIKRIDQQIRVTKIMIDCCDPTQIECKKLKKYLIKYLIIMMTITSVLLMKENTPESLDKKKDLWNYLNKKNKNLYREVTKSTLGILMQIKNLVVRNIILFCYSVSRKVFGFN